MIRSIEVRNFRGFESLTIPNCKRINIIVGDSGAGKTALLEAIFLALSGNLNVVPRFRAQRGLEGGMFQGHPQQITEAIFGDLFYRLDMERTLEVALSGDGPDQRSVRATSSPGDEILPFSGIDRPTVQAGVTFTWKNAAGREFQVNPTISTEGIKIPGSEETLPDYFYIPSGANASSVENANTFSKLSRARLEKDFVKLFTDQYDWLEDFSIETSAGIPLIHASVKGVPEKLPVSLVSGAINRMVAILLSAASRKRHVMLVDEIENGIYHSRHARFWNALVGVTRSQEGQLSASCRRAGANARDPSHYRDDASPKRPAWKSRMRLCGRG